MCVLADTDHSAGDLAKRVQNLLQTIKYKLVVLEDGNSSIVVDYTTLKNTISGAMWFPTPNWVGLSQALAGLFTYNACAYKTGAGIIGNPGSVSFPFPNYAGPENMQGIQCSDYGLRTDDLDDLAPILDQYLATSSISGHLDSIEDLICARWKMSAKERYTGGFVNINLKRHPLLLVGNSADPVTPLVAAYNVSAGFPGGAVLQNNGYGVCYPR